MWYWATNIIELCFVSIHMLLTHLYYVLYGYYNSSALCFQVRNMYWAHNSTSSPHIIPVSHDVHNSSLARVAIRASIYINLNSTNIECNTLALASFVCLARIQLQGSLVFSDPLLFIWPLCKIAFCIFPSLLYLSSSKFAMVHHSFSCHFEPFINKKWCSQ